MRLSASATAFVLSLSLPVLMTEAGLVDVPLSEPAAFAQGADAVTEVARQRYEEGVKAYEGGRFEDARNAFAQVYALKRHPAVLLNLGLSEVRSNYPVEGGNHLQQFLRENTSTTPDQRATAEKFIADAKKRAGLIIVIVDAMGADVSIDGKVVGKSPMMDPVFVKPGKYTVSATQGGKTASIQVDAKTGALTPASVSMSRATSAPPPAPTPTPTPPPVAPTPAPTPTPAAPPTAAPVGPMPPPGPASPANPGPGPGISPLDPALNNMGTTPGMGPDEPVPDTGGKEPFFAWYKRKPLAWVGTGVTGAGLVVGAVFTGLWVGAKSTYDKHAEEVRTYGESNNQPGPWCGSETEGGSDLVGYEKACDTLRSDNSKIATNGAVMATGWVFFGVGALGTAAYAIVDWYLPNKKKTGSADPGVRVMSVAPILTPTHQGFGLTGTF